MFRLGKGNISGSQLLELPTKFRNRTIRACQAGPLPADNGYLASDPVRLLLGSLQKQTEPGKLLHGKHDSDTLPARTSSTTPQKHKYPATSPPIEPKTCVHSSRDKAVGEIPIHHLEPWPTKRNAQRPPLGGGGGVERSSEHPPSTKAHSMFAANVQLTEFMGHAMNPRLVVSSMRSQIPPRFASPAQQACGDKFFGLLGLHSAAPRQLRDRKGRILQPLSPTLYTKLRHLEKAL